jgi:hypothetical protein
MKCIIVDNFFDDFFYIRDYFKNIKLYDLNTYRKFKDIENPKLENWPGKRSKILHNTEPFLFSLFMKNFYEKFNNPFNQKKFNVKTHIHLRLEKDNELDWIHKDCPEDYSLLVYLSETNLNSGTALYDEDKNLITDIKFVQNRAILFDSNYNHRAIQNHGNNIHNGRLTFNAFFKLL